MQSVFDTEILVIVLQRALAGNRNAVNCVFVGITVFFYDQV